MRSLGYVTIRSNVCCQNLPKFITKSLAVIVLRAEGVWSGLDTPLVRGAHRIQISPLQIPVR